MDRKKARYYRYTVRSYGKFCKKKFGMLLLCCNDFANEYIICRDWDEPGMVFKGKPSVNMIKAAALCIKNGETQEEALKKWEQEAWLREKFLREEAQKRRYYKAGRASG